MKSVIHSMLLYSFHVYSWPIALLNQLDNCIRNFIWAGDVNVRKLVTVAWKKVCKPTNEGGLGIQSWRPLINYVKSSLWYGFKRNMHLVFENSC